VLAAASKKLRERFAACPRGSRPWLIVAISFVLATAMFGCSAAFGKSVRFTRTIPELFIRSSAEQA
jgi:hypothetical protein